MTRGWRLHFNSKAVNITLGDTRSCSTAINECEGVDAVNIQSDKIFILQRL